MPDNILSHKARLVQAIALVVFGYFAYSVADLCSKKLQEVYSVHQILTLSGLFGLSVTGLWLAIKHGAKSFLPANLPLHILRALTVMGTAYFMVRSLLTLPLADFYGIVFITPFFVKILAVVFLNEKVGWRRWVAALVGFSGIVILASPQFNHIGEGVVCALLGALCAAANIVMLKKIGPAPIPLYGFYAFLAVTLFNFGMMASLGLFRPFTIEYAGYFIVHGPIILLGVLTVSMGFARAPETVVVAPFQYTQIIWGVVFGWAFFHVMPTMTTWIGLILIIGAGLYSLRREYKHAHHLG